MHWLLFNMPASTDALTEAATPPAGSAQGRNDLGVNGYRGPCPPPGHGAHRYFFRLYALDAELQVEPAAGRKALESAISHATIREKSANPRPRIFSSTSAKG